MRGHGAADFLADRDAVAQIIATTLKLLQAEWWENLTIGTPLFQELIGQPITAEGIALILRKRILSVPYVTGIQNVAVSYTPPRQFAFSAAVQTAFGEIAVSTQPSIGAQATIAGS